MYFLSFILSLQICFSLILYLRFRRMYFLSCHSFPHCLSYVLISISHLNAKLYWIRLYAADSSDSTNIHRFKEGGEKNLIPEHPSYLINNCRGVYSRWITAGVTFLSLFEITISLWGYAYLHTDFVLFSYFLQL